jgi:hypothetical protein
MNTNAEPDQPQEYEPIDGDEYGFMDHTLLVETLNSMIPSISRQD